MPGCGVEDKPQEPDSYTGREPPPPGVGPGTQKFEPLPTPDSHPRELERNVCVGPLVVSSCQCPKCGEVFAHYEVFVGGYHACLGSEEQPLCPRCTFATAWPAVTPEVAAAMVECRWRYHEHLLSGEPGSGKSTGEMRAAFLKAYDAFWLYGPALLGELERVFGDQVTAAVAAIEGGVSGVEVENPR